jgi:hypothetical protein
MDTMIGFNPKNSPEFGNPIYVPETTGFSVIIKQCNESSELKPGTSISVEGTKPTV